MSSLVVALLSFAIALVIGALLSKAFFATQSPAKDVIARDQHHALLKAQRSRYRKRVHALHNAVRRHEDTQRKIKEKLAEYHQTMKARAKAGRVAGAEVAKLQTQLKTEHAKSATAANELGLLRIERDELTARVQRLEQEQHANREEGSDLTPAADEPAAELRAGMGELREKLATRDRRIHELNVQLQDSEAQKQHVRERLETLKGRIAPLTQKLRQQRQLLRQASASAAPGKSAVNRQRDDLKEIRGIGPALERRLRSHGIERFEQIAAMSEEEFAAMAARLSIAPTLAQRQGWIQQAQDLQRSLYRSS
jgi:predicted flap endonuclease-1-like 5' DNA nuclease